MPRKYGRRRPRPRSEFVRLRVTPVDKERWRQAAPQGNISGWLRSLAEQELLLATNRRTVRKVLR